jgi:hypothetical protein
MMPECVTSSETGLAGSDQNNLAWAAGLGAWPRYHQGALAQRSGLSEDELTKQLSQVLPGVVDKLTPAGRLPTLAAELSQTM